MNLPPTAGLLLLFTILCSVLFAHQTSVDIQKKKVVIRDLGQCKGGDEEGKIYSIMWYNVTMGRLGNESNSGNKTISLKVSIRNRVSEDFRIALSVWKCDSSGNPDNCEYVLKDFQVKGVCEYMMAKGQAWSVFMEHFDEQLRCPIKPGTYSISDIPVSSDFLKFLPVSDAVYKARIEGFDGDEKISCVEMLMQVVALHDARRRKGSRN